MNFKNYLLCVLLVISGQIIKSAEIEQESKQEKEQTNYEKLLVLFPDIESTLISNKISKEDINNTDDFFTSPKHKTASFKKSDKLICFIFDKSTQEWEVVNHPWIDLNKVIVI